MRDRYQWTDVKHTKGDVEVAFQSVHLLFQFEGTGSTKPTQHSFEAGPGTRAFVDSQVSVLGQGRTGLRATNEVTFLRRTDQGFLCPNPFPEMHMYQAQE